MPGQIFDRKRVLDPWLEGEPDADLRIAVLNKVMWIADNVELISGWPAMPGQHPLKRSIEVDEGALITFLLTTPVRGARLLRIESLSLDE